MMRSDILWLSKHGTCNICIFNATAAATGAAALQDCTTLDKLLAISMEHNTCEQSFKRLPINQIAFPLHYRLLGVKPKYSSGVLRHHIYFDSIDVHKYYIQIKTDQVHAQKP
jgi:hypothetical protein